MTGRLLWSLTCAAVAFASVCPDALAAATDDGRKFLREASALAADGQCAAAVPAYAKAYVLLRDPVILFNRAECFRKLGEREEALNDYRQFLFDFPKAPNRAMVEQRIAEMSVAPHTVVLSDPVMISSGKKNPITAKPVAGSQVSAAPALARGAGTQMDDPFDPRPARKPVSPEGPGDETDAQPASDSLPRARPLPRRPPPKPAETWVWVTVGATVLAGAAAGLYLMRRDPTQIPESTLGGVRF